MSKLITCGVPDELKNLPEINPAGTRRLEVTCDHVTVGLQAVRSIKGLRNATVFGQSMDLLVDEVVTDAVILDHLKRVGIHHADIRPTTPSLEDVFVTLTELNTVR